MMGTRWQLTGRGWLVVFLLFGAGMSGALWKSHWDWEHSTPIRAALASLPVQIGIGCEAPTGTDSSEFGRLFGPNTINPTWVRIQCLWSRTETTPGLYDWRVLDNQFHACTVSNLTSIGWPLAVPAQPKIMFEVNEPPAWYTNSTATQAGYIAGEVRFLRAVVSRYWGAITWVEPINEPDGGCNWIPGCSNIQQNAQFAAVLIAACRAVRMQQPNLLFAGPSNTGPEDTDWNNYFQAAGGFQSCDVVTWHDYRMNTAGHDQYSPFDSVPGQLKPFATDCQSMRGYAGTKPMMITEVGIGSVSNAIAFVVIAQKYRVVGLAPVGIMAPGPWSYWDWANGTLTPAGLAFISTENALNRAGK